VIPSLDGLIENTHGPLSIQVIPLDDDNPKQGYACTPVSVTGQRSLLDNSTDLDMINMVFPHPVDGDAVNIQSLKKLVISELPPRDKAISLINLYYGRVAWEYVVIYSDT
jgi:hypothetical protein